MPLNSAALPGFPVPTLGVWGSSWLMRQLAWPPFTWLATAQPHLQHIHHNHHQSKAHLPQIISLRSPRVRYTLNPLRQSLQRLSTVQPTEVCYITLFLFFRLKIPNWTWQSWDLGKDHILLFCLVLDLRGGSRSSFGDVGEVYALAARFN